MKIIKEVMTFKEAQERWGLSESTLRGVVNRSDRFVINVDYRKSAGTHIITKEAMLRVFGKENLKFTGEQLYNDENLQKIVKNAIVLSHSNYKNEEVKYSSSELYQLFSPESFWKGEKDKKYVDDYWYIANGVVPNRIHKKDTIIVEID